MDCPAATTVRFLFDNIVKRSTGQTPFKLVYGQEVVMPVEYIVPSLIIAASMGMDDEAMLKEHMEQLIQLEEDCFITGFHQHVEKDRRKSWHDHHVMNKQFQQGDLVLLYENKFMKHPGKLQMHWLGPYLVNSITFGGQFKCSN